MPRAPKSLSDLLTELYTTPNKPSALGGVDKLYRAAKAVRKSVTKRLVRDWFTNQRSYILHKPAKRKTTGRKILVTGPDAQWQADLLDVAYFANSNDGCRFLLVVIDMFSKYVWVLPLLSKHGSIVASAFDEIFKTAEEMKHHRVCDSLQTDAGKEFLAHQVQDLLRRRGIKYFRSLNPDVKAMVVERFNRTLRDKIYRYMTQNNTEVYMNVLQDLVHGYNHSVHSTIKVAPADVTEQNQKEIYLRTYRPNYEKQKGPTFKVGDQVVIQRKKGHFEKGATANWTDEHFVVVRVVHTDPDNYRLTDSAGEEILGAFYAQDIQRVSPDQDTWYPIDKVLKTRTRRGKKESLVSFVGWPEKFNTWVATVKDI